MKQEYDVTDDETKVSVVASFSINDGESSISEKSDPLVITETKRLAFGQCVVKFQFNQPPQTADKLRAEYHRDRKLLAERLRIIADDLEKRSGGCRR